MKRTPLKRRTELKPRERDATCAWCQVSFISRPTRLGWSKFCSRACSAMANRRTVTVVCICGTEFETRPSRPQRKCSAACAREAKSRANRGKQISPETVEKARRTHTANIAKREAGIVPDKGKCARPGCQNPLTGQAHKYCSPRCHYDDRSRAGRRKQAYHRCHHCGDVFAWNGRGRGIFCSPTCKNSVSNRVRREPEVVEIVQIRGHRRSEFRDEAESCRACGAPALHQHHVVYRQHIERLKGDRWHPDDALSLCRRCHYDAHKRLLPVSVLRVENLAFAVDLLGAYAVDYLRRYYHDDGDPRLRAMELKAAA